MKDETFQREFAKLNAAQKSAVENFSGAQMVVAGPGTGKTQLLAMRVANILRQTDADASNILCLTFTENAAQNMVERLAKIIGRDAYKVAIHTFHGFGTEVISRHNEYFFGGAVFRPADEITQSEILSEIFANLPYDNPLAKTMNGQWTYLNDATKTISDLKKAGLTPDETREILQQNLKFCLEILPDFQKTFEKSISRATLISAKNLLLTAEKLAMKQKKFSFTSEPNLAQIFSKSLKRALEECAILGDKTSPLTKWKKDFATKNDAGNLILTDEKRSEKLFALTEIYEKYSAKMREQNFFDFDDMILDVCRAIEKNPDLKFDLQEKFQYILVDEFQDTNDVQMRLLNDLTDYDLPNVMIVGDDDQAIYRFQGADISNILRFSEKFPDTKTVVLTENYRSGEKILRLAENVAQQIGERLDNSKILSKNVDFSAEISREICESAEDENFLVAEKVAEKIAHGENPAEIAIIARNHKQLENLLPFFAAKNLPVDYERARNILNSEPIILLTQFAILTDAIARGNREISDEIFSKILAHESFKIDEIDLFKISISAHEKRKSWLEILLEFSARTKNIAEFFLRMAKISNFEPLENMLDKLFGTHFSRNFANDENDDFDDFENVKNENSDINFAEKNAQKNGENNFYSPLFDYFFGAEKLAKNPEIYLNFLNDLSTLRRKLRDFRPDKKLALADFLEFIEKSENLAKPIVANSGFGGENSVKFLTAHKAKGLEFDTVFVVGATSEIWGAKSRARSSNLPLPHNMPYRLTGENDDEKLRLLFVALTRARKNLFVISHKFDGEKSFLPVEYLLDLPNFDAKILPKNDAKTVAKNLEISLNFNNDFNDNFNNNFNDFAENSARNLRENSENNFEKSEKNLKNFVQKNAENSTKNFEKNSPKNNKNNENARKNSMQNFEKNQPQIDEKLRQLLSEKLANYKLSATHLNNFIDLQNAGPQAFLMQNLLHFPEAKSAQAAFGTAIHGALQRAHNFLLARGAKKPLEDVLGDFSDFLDDADLSERDTTFYQKKGADALTNFYEKRIASFSKNQRAEYSFAGENSVFDGAKLTGKIDLLDVDKNAKIIKLTDYKTGKPATSWNGKTPFEKIKLHKYRQQLLFYKILLENSREFAGWKIERGILEFVEPTANGEISRVELFYDEISDEMADFKKLVSAVFRRILGLDFPDVSEFSADFQGILDFEKFLREN